jgi:hypothetical protein
LKATPFVVEAAIDGVYVAGVLEASIHADACSLEHGQQQHRGRGRCHFDGSEAAGLGSFRQVIQA